MRFDSATGDFRDYGKQGPDVDGGLYHVAADTRHLYSTLGGMPYLLNAYDFETGEQEVIRTWDLPERAVLIQRPQGIFVVVDVQPESLLYTQPTDEIVQVYRLENKVLTPVEALPPEDDSALIARIPVPKPEILKTSPVCRGDGSATLWFRRPGETWRSVTWTAAKSPSYLFRLGAWQGGIIGSSEDPYNLFTYDIESGKKSLVGGIALHVYAFQEFEGLVYFCGYAGGALYAWDPAKPWTRQPQSALVDEPAEDSPEANPRRVAKYELQRRSYTIVRAADNRLYIPMGAYIESIPGGLLGWYDPTTEESGGIRDEFEHAKGMDAVAALHGRYVVTATNPWPEPTEAFADADLVTYDTKRKQVIGRVAPKAGCLECSVLIEWTPGKILGRFTENEQSEADAITTFYIFDVESQSCEPVLTTAGVPRNRMILLESGNVGCLFNDRIAEVDPESRSMEFIGRFDSPPRDWFAVETDLYVILETEIHRYPRSDLHSSISRR